MKTKTCSRCHIDKPLSSFGRDRCQKDGRKYYCLSCDRAMQREAHQARKEGKGKRPKANVPAEHICTDECETSRFGFCIKRRLWEQQARRAGMVVETRTGEGVEARR